jgi:hypothetical protein
MKVILLCYHGIGPVASTPGGADSGVCLACLSESLRNSAMQRSPGMTRGFFAVGKFQLGEPSTPEYLGRPQYEVLDSSL